MRNRVKKISVLLLIIFIWTSTMVGCTTVPTVAVPPPVASVDKKIDLSPYMVVAPPKESNNVPIEPHLSYIDTAYLMNLMRINGDISQQRTSYDQYAPDWTFVLVDSRPPARFKEAHINGSINIPDAQFDQYAHLLPADKNKMIIFYCGGLHCHLSPSSANKAIALGYTNVHVYQEGTDFWTEARNYYVTTPEYVATLITTERVNDVKAKPFLIIDARPFNVYFESHIPTAVHMDDRIFMEKYLQAVPVDKKTEIIVYCGGFFCHKSHYIAHLLVNRGYQDVKVLAGGNPAWKAAGYPMFGAAAAGGSFDITGGKPNRKLSPTEFQQRMAGSNVVILDVRNDQERATGAIRGSIHIQDTRIMADPKAIANLLPADKSTTILIHCAAGARAAGVVDKIAELGYANTFYLDGRIMIGNDGSYSF